MSYDGNSFGMHANYIIITKSNIEEYGVLICIYNNINVSCIWYIDKYNISIDSLYRKQYIMLSSNKHTRVYKDIVQTINIYVYTHIIRYRIL